MISKKCLNTKGFTLVELMIVIAIIGILAAVALPNFISYRDRTYCTYAEQDAQSVCAAIISYFSDPRRTNMPTISDLEDLEQLSTNNAAASITITEAAGATLISVTDDSARCPRGTTFTKTYGGSAMGSWH